jgi:membrane-associated phospholipid phosphatase
MRSIVVAALIVQILCAIINHWWKISIHTAAIGGTTGAVVAFSLIFGFYPLWWLCLLILLAGVLGTSRMLLRIHSLGEIVGGYLIGVLAGFTGVVI